MSLSCIGTQDLTWWIKNIENIENWIHPPKIEETLSADASKYNNNMIK